MRRLSGSGLGDRLRLGGSTLRLPSATRGLPQVESHLAAYMVQGFLWKAAIARLYASGAQSGAETYSPTALDRALDAGMHRRVSRRR